jgi:MFS family permease
MEPAQFAIITSIFTLGGLIGALAAGPFATKYGRRPPLQIAAIFFVLGPLLSALTPNIPLFGVGRFLSGVGSGAALVIVPIYISEVVPADRKGSFGALTQITINVGILLAQVLGFFMSYGALWRGVLGVAGGIAALQAAGLLAVVESPRWTAQKGRTGAAARALGKIRGTQNVEEEIDSWGPTGAEGEGNNTSLSMPTSKSR